MRNPRRLLRLVVAVMLRRRLRIFISSQMESITNTSNCFGILQRKTILQETNRLLSSKNAFAARIKRDWAKNSANC
jgi:hypothetical protein